MDINLAAGVSTQALVPLDPAALGASARADRTDIQVATCDQGVWTQVPRRIVNSSATTTSQELAVTFWVPTGPGTLALLVGAMNPPLVLDDPTQSLPRPTGTPGDTVAFWPLAGSTLMTGGEAVASTPGTASLFWAGGATVPQNLFVGGVEAGAIRGVTGRGLSGSLFTTGAPAVLPAGGGTPIHVSLWVHRAGGSPNQIIARTIGGLNGTTVGWQLWWEENFGRISFTVFDQRVSSCGGENTQSCTARVNANNLGGNTDFHFVEVSWSPNNGPMCIYVDGARRENRTGPSDIRQVAASNRFHVAHLGNLTQSFDGNLGNLQVDTAGLNCTQSTRSVPPRLPRAGTLQAPSP